MSATVSVFLCLSLLLTYVSMRNAIVAFSCHINLSYLHMVVARSLHINFYFDLVHKPLNERNCSSIKDESITINYEWINNREIRLSFYDL